MADAIYTPFVELQARIGIPDIDVELAARSALITRWANHAALYDNFGLWDSERKRRLAMAALQVRAAKESLGVKFTQGMIDDESHTWPSYSTFLNESITGKAEWLVAKDRIDSITQRIQRANVVARFAASEPR